MLDWCTEHPWMTFFIVLAMLYTLRVVVRAMFKRPDGD